MKRFWVVGPLAAIVLLFACVAAAQEPKFPEFSDEARQGGAIFMGSCASCHGLYLQGTEKGPPLLHKYYEPSHHGDETFYVAAKLGARQHHWNFGNMPPVEGITDEQIALIIRYVREMQKANGIY